MGLFNFLGAGTDINSGVSKYKADPQAVLLDVRTPPEYRSGHIEGSINIPLDKISTIEKRSKTKTPRFTYIARAEQEAGRPFPI